MQLNKRFVLSWLAGACIVLMLFYAATAWLWSAVRTSAASALENQVSSMLANDLAEGNLFKLGASLSRLMQAGSLDYAEIRSYSPSDGWESIFRTHSHYGDTAAAFSGFTCGSQRRTVPHGGEGVSIVTVLPSNIEGSECVALFLSSDLPADLKSFHNKLSVVFGLVLSLMLAFFLYLTIAWHKRALGLEVAAKTAQAEKEAAVGRMAAQVAHDIRSPLVALDATLKHAAFMPEEQRVMLRHAVNRIRDIANNLLEKNRPSQEGSAEVGHSAPGAAVCLLSSLVDSVIAEKRMQYGPAGTALDFDMTPEAYGIFAAVQPAEFSRLLSNILNNAAEAIEGNGRVSVTLASSGGRALLKVTDNGKGIAAELIGKLARKGATFGKPGGSGLGLYHARTTVESWGGKLDIVSEQGKGTTVSVELPAAAAPEWFVTSLYLPAGRQVVVLDDDQTIHRVWQGRFESARVAEKGVELISFSSADKLRGWVRENPGKAAGARYLLDYELLDSKETGLGLAGELGLTDRAILVTSRYEEKHVLEECLRLKMRMIPKGLAGLVPISAGGQVKTAALIDDDALVRLN